jgi:PIN domain nuclease of toxin-antitoxin system
MSPDNPRFVVDTHALWWYLRSPERLSAAASAVFRLAEIGSATIVVPAIVIAEFYFLSVKLGQPLVPDKLLSALAEVDGIELSPLGRAQLARLDQFPEIPEMHDKLIAAESAALNAPVITRDGALIESSQVESVWRFRQVRLQGRTMCYTCATGLRSTAPAPPVGGTSWHC